MSHFACVVLCPAGTTLDSADPAVERLLAPYDENTEVTEYQKDCYCIGREAYSAAYDAAVEKHGSIDQLRTAFHANPNPRLQLLSQRWVISQDLTEDEAKEYKELNTAENERWKAHVAPFHATVDEAVSAHPMAGKPNPLCDECEGSGKRMTNYNPRSKWDWWSVGGRFTGWLGKGITGEYDPAKDPKNEEWCDTCGGTGRRDDELGKNARLLDPTYTCNGCAGKGRRVKWPTEWKSSEQDVVPTYLLEGQNKVPFAIVTPDGEWHEQGEMGWWAIVSNEVDEKEWATQVATIYALFPNTVAVTVDCHI